MLLINFLLLPVTYGAVQRLAPRQDAPPPSQCVDTTQLKYTAELYSDQKCTVSDEISEGTAYVGTCFKVAGIVSAKAYLKAGIPKGYVCDTTLFPDSQCAEDGVLSKPLDQTNDPECLTGPHSLTSLIIPTKYNSIRILCYQQLLTQ
ncbi:hypothetical protein TI39_contig379g00014 [Zymoseptoria brevis]|uniref:Uncharacterized protein n=1 Tax=Zymoseptoria brevis TaxID=1047168 RepID=A0A0F4GNL6_9PEZI|nr:hypothetical protein TI39_contig379g00014 [Zymoseptoria brevis]